MFAISLSLCIYTNMYVGLYTLHDVIDFNVELEVTIYVCMAFIFILCMFLCIVFCICVFLMSTFIHFSLFSFSFVLLFVYLCL